MDYLVNTDKKFIAFKRDIFNINSEQEFKFTIPSLGMG